MHTHIHTHMHVQNSLAGVLKPSGHGVAGVPRQVACSQSSLIPLSQGSCKPILSSECHGRIGLGSPAQEAWESSQGRAKLSVSFSQD